MRPGTSEVERPSRDDALIEARYGRTRELRGRGWSGPERVPRRTALPKEVFGISRLHALIAPLDAARCVDRNDRVLHAVDHGFELRGGSRRRR